MFEAWRLKYREAEEALKQGRLDEAGQLLNDGELRGYLPAKKLLAKVAQGLIDRGNARLQRGETAAGWRDAQTASQWGAQWQVVAGLRRELLDKGMQEVRDFLAAGDYAAAQARLDELARREPANADLRKLLQATQHAAAAQRLARSGRLAEAVEEQQSAATLCPEIKPLAQRREQLAASCEQARGQEQTLHQALAASDWQAVLAAADALLEVSPAHEAARDARRRAWAAVGTQLAATQVPQARFAPRRAMQLSPHDLADPKNLAPQGHVPGPRFVLWIDAVGGYLVCQGDRIVIGQPDRDAGVDVGILGDLSRQHAIVERIGEGYVLHPLRAVKIDSQPVTQPTPLHDGALLTLGETVQMRFRRPHALSQTARLEFASRHRTQPPVDGVILMSDSCVLGPGRDSHVVCPQWPHEVVLFGRGEELGCRAPAGLEIDGVRYEGRGTVRPGSRITGEAFSLSLESI
ncbi:MAG: hypothetical protein K1X74_14495 [Pirellulales bacterium]|nr:hypothetical protein [Pirellulales bacterium]